MRRNHMFQVLFLVLLVVMLPSAAGTALCSAEKAPVDSIIERSLQNLDESGVGRSIDDVTRDVLGEGGFKKILKDILSGKGVDFRALVQAVWISVAPDLVLHSQVLGKIVLAGVAVACMEILASTISPEGSNRLAVIASNLTLVVLAIVSFKEVLEIARDAITTLRTAFFSFIPALTTLIMASGARITALAINPVVFGMGYVVSIAVMDFAFPLIYTAVALDLAGSLGGGDRASGVAELLRQVALATIGLFMAAFVGAVVGQRAASGVADGVALRTAKYVSSTFIPVAGKMVGDTMDMFFYASSALRSAMGLAGSIGLMLMAFSPLVRILACLLVWKISYAVLGPICSGEMRRSLKAMADGVSHVGVVVLVVTFVFVICLSLVAGAVRFL